MITQLYPRSTSPQPAHLILVYWILISVTFSMGCEEEIELPMIPDDTLPEVNTRDEGEQMMTEMLIPPEGGSMDAGDDSLPEWVDDGTSTGGMGGDDGEIDPTQNPGGEIGTGGSSPPIGQGSLTCLELIDCAVACTMADNACLDQCLMSGTQESVNILLSYLQCDEDYGCEGDQECLGLNCTNEINACLLDMGSGGAGGTESTGGTSGAGGTEMQGGTSIGPNDFGQGTLSCAEIFDCFDLCTFGDTPCMDQCLINSSPVGASLYIALAECNALFDCQGDAFCLDLFCSVETSNCLTSDGGGTIGGSCTDDIYEENDDNTEPTISSLITPETPLYICQEDEDWFSIEVCEGASLIAEISFDGFAGDLDMEVLDPEGRYAGSSSGTGSTERVEIDPTVLGAYAVQVYGYSGAENSYSLNLSVGGCDSCVLDTDCEGDLVCDSGLCQAPPPPECTLSSDCELNEECVEGVCGLRSCETAIDCQLNQECVEGTCVAPECLTSIDCEPFEECSAGSCVQIICVLNSECGLNGQCVDGVCEPTMCILDSDCDLGEGCVEGDCVPTMCVINSDCAPGEECTAGACVPTMSEEMCEADFYEPNDTVLTAAYLILDEETLSICDGNQDFFQVRVCAGGTVTLTVDFDSIDLDIDLELFGSDQMTRVDSSALAGGRESVSYTNTEQLSELIYLRVFDYFEYDSGPYTLTVTEEECP